MKVVFASSLLQYLGNSHSLVLRKLVSFEKKVHFSFKCTLSILSKNNCQPLETRDVRSIIARGGGGGGEGMKSLQFAVNNSSELSSSCASFKFQRLDFSAVKGSNNCLKHYCD